MSADCARPYYQDTGRRPCLYYAVIGMEEGKELEISRSRHRVDEIPAGLTLSGFRRAQHGREMDQLLNIFPSRLLEGPALYEQAKAARNWLILQGTVQRDDTLDYLRNAVGIIQAALETGAAAVLDLFALRFFSSERWTREIFSEPFSPWVHASILSSPMEDGTLWLHTRGMLKFGRPDIGLKGVQQSEQGRAAEIFQQMIFCEAQGAAFPRPAKLHLGTGGACTVFPALAGDRGDPDYNNEHYSLRWEDCQFENQ